MFVAGPQALPLQAAVLSGVQHMVPAQTPALGQLAEHWTCWPQLFVPVVLHTPVHAVALSGVQHVPSDLHTSLDEAQFTVPPAPHEIDCPQLFIAVPHDLPAHVVATGSGTQPHAPVVHDRPPSHPGQVIVWPQSSVTMPQRFAHHVAGGVGVQHVPFAVHTPPFGQVAGHTACWPQRFMTVTPHLPRQAVASSGVQQVPLAAQTSVDAAHEAVPLSPQVTTWPQLFVATPQFFPAHVCVAGSGAQPQLPLTHAAPPSHEPQSTWLPQLSYSCPHRFAQKFATGTQLLASSPPASGWGPPLSAVAESRPIPLSGEGELPSGPIVASLPPTEPSPTDESTPPSPGPSPGAVWKSPRSVEQPPTANVAPRATRSVTRCLAGAVMRVNY